MTETAFTPVNPKLATVRILSELLVMVPVLVALVVLALLFPHWSWWVGGAVLVVVVGWSCWLIRRQVKALGYLERDVDLLIKRGIMFRSTTVIPYGRLQFVDVKSGPLERLFGLSQVTLHTASAATDATVSGLATAEADRLRDRLANRGEAQLAGI